jgi:PleD family two-component response regulator
MHGGAIGFTSRAGVGSTFAFYVKGRRSTVPRRQSDDSTAAVSISLRAQASALTSRSHDKKDQLPDQPVGLTANTADLHVLVVEDNIVNQRVLAKQLRNIGMKVTVANHGGEALEHLCTTKYCVTDAALGIPLSVVLMDWEMPVSIFYFVISGTYANP